MTPISFSIKDSSGNFINYGNYLRASDSPNRANAIDSLQDATTQLDVDISTSGADPLIVEIKVFPVHFSANTFWYASIIWIDLAQLRKDGVTLSVISQTTSI